MNGCTEPEDAPLDKGVSICTCVPVKQVQTLLDGFGHERGEVVEWYFSICTFVLASKVSVFVLLYW